jgi:hypothetical protein
MVQNYVLKNILEPAWYNFGGKVILSKMANTCITTLPFLGIVVET